MTHLRNLLIAAFIIFLPIQDLRLRGTFLGMFGSNLSVLPLACLVVLALGRWTMQPPWRISKTALVFFGYAVVINVVSLIRFGTTALGASLISKTIALAVITSLWIFVVFCLDYASVPHFGLYLKLAFLVAVLGVIASDLGPAGLGAAVNNSILHLTDKPDPRWRGLSSEAGHLSTVAISIGLLAAQFAKRKLAKGFIAALSLLIMVVSGSKGGTVTLAMTCLLLAITNRIPRRMVVKASAVMIPLLCFAALRLASESSLEVLQEATTITTRSTVAFWGVSSLLANPFGLGFGGYYATLEKSLPASMDLVSRWAPFPLNFYEVAGYAVSSENASTKIFFLDLALFLGLPFVIWLGKVLWQHSTRLTIERHALLLTAFWFVSIAMCSYADAPTAYSSFLVFGVVISEARKL
jgi:hypothetical protein